MRRPLALAAAVLAALAAAFAVTIAAAGNAQAYTTKKVCGYAGSVPSRSGTAYTCVTWILSTNGAGASVARPQYCWLYNNTNGAIAVYRVDYGVVGKPYVQTQNVNDSPSGAGYAAAGTYTYWDCGLAFTSWGYYPTPQLQVKSYVYAPYAGATTYLYAKD
jgi:hypothetical protein